MKRTSTTTPLPPSSSAGTAQRESETGDQSSGSGPCVSLIDEGEELGLTHRQSKWLRAQPAGFLKRRRQ